MIIKALLFWAASAGLAIEFAEKNAKRKIDKQNIYEENQKLFIKCLSMGIPYVDFKTFVQGKGKDRYLYIKATTIKDSIQDIVSVEHKYLLKNITDQELQKRKTYIEPDYEYPKYVVEIPLDSVDKKVSVSRKDD